MHVCNRSENTSRTPRDLEQCIKGNVADARVRSRRAARRSWVVACSRQAAVKCGLRL